MKVDLVDSMGDDLRIVNAARVSFNKKSSYYYHINGKEIVPERYAGPGNPLGMVKELREGDRKLINYLAKHGHWTPFAHAMITVREKVPIFVARQRFKHMVGFTYNEVSRRYVDDEPEFFYPDKWRARPEGSVKQGSSEEEVTEIPVADQAGLLFPLKGEYHQHLVDSEDLYEAMIESGVAPEQARMVLPQSMYTEYYVTGSLAAFARAYKQRIDSDAQVEIQELAKEWDRIISPLFPVAWEALTND